MLNCLSGHNEQYNSHCPEYIDSDDEPNQALYNHNRLIAFVFTKAILEILFCSSVLFCGNSAILKQYNYKIVENAASYVFPVINCTCTWFLNSLLLKYQGSVKEAKILTKLFLVFFLIIKKVCSKEK